MSNDSEKEPIFAAPPAYGGESAPIYQERTKTKQMVILPQSLYIVTTNACKVPIKCCILVLKEVTEYMHYVQGACL